MAKSQSTQKSAGQFVGRSKPAAKATRNSSFASGLLPTWLSERVAVPALLFLATLARFATITRANIWHDEGFSMMLVGRNAADIWLGSGRDVHPPLYYELLHYWTSIFGVSELAARSMSAIAGILTLYVGYLLVRRYFARTTGYLVLFVLAIAPFLVRYSQEARMYGVLGLFLITGTYLLLRALDHPKQAWRWAVYAVVMAAGMYTHYFTVLALAAHWLYVMSLTGPRKWKIGKTVWLSPQWWLANVGIIVLWAPWIPSFIGQFTRGQGIGWIQKTTILTLPNNLWQNLTFTDGGQLPPIIYWMIPLLILIGVTWATLVEQRKHPAVRLIYFYTFVPIIGTILISLLKPVYQDRYLVFAANGLYILIGITLHTILAKRKALALTLTAILAGFCLVGIVNVGRQATHSMGRVGTYVSQHFMPGDEIISGELYTYFDFSYYCTVCIDSRNEMVWGGRAIPAVYPSHFTTLRLNTTGGRPNGYGESALLYDRAESIYLDDFEAVQPLSKRVWLIGKPDKQTYWTNTPLSWQEIDRYQTNSSEARLYQLP